MTESHVTEQVLPALPPALKRFIWDIQSMVELDEGTREILFIGRDLMSRLVASDDWLPPAFAASGCRLLYSDGMARFSPVCLVLAPGEATTLAENPFWRLSGVLRGSVLRRRFAAAEGGPADEKPFFAGGVEGAVPGGFIQWVNRDSERPAVVIQVFGGEAHGCDTSDGPPPFDIWSIQTRIED
jgi:predicted metal-dependent enzyme (double-stranded beta helix superfamily)